jgi:hypothetical protein
MYSIYIQREKKEHIEDFNIIIFLIIDIYSYFNYIGEKTKQNNSRAILGTIKNSKKCFQLKFQ